MDSPILTVAEAPQPAISEEAAIKSKALRWFELLLVLMFSFGDYLFSSVARFANPGIAEPALQNLRWIMSLFHEVTALLLLGYVLFRRRIRFKDLGLRWSMGELGRGAVLWVGSYMAYIFGSAFINVLHRILYSSSPGVANARAIFGHGSLIMIPFFLLNPFFEEMIVRAYLMTEVTALTGSWALAGAVSVAVQTSYHLYYGWTTALALGCQFLVFSVYFARTRRATPLVFAHGLFDMLGLVQLF